MNGGMRWKARLFFVFQGIHRVLLNAWEMKEGSNEPIPCVIRYVIPLPQGRGSAEWSLLVVGLVICFSFLKFRILSKYM